jgi:proteasome accessory factor B
MRKVERLVNLTALLLDTPRPLTLDEVAEMVPGYEASGESLRRMFERDKEELRGLGVPVERAAVDAWGNEEGYFIDPKAYGMPELDLAPDERAALALAARAWSGAGLDPAAVSGLAKLDLDPDAAGEPVQADLAGGNPLVATLLEAVTNRKRIAFAYQPPGRDAAERRLEPYALVHQRGTWYVVGRDLDRAAQRSFRLSRIQSEVRRLRPTARGADYEVPEDFDPGQALPTAGEHGGAEIALVRAGRSAARVAELRGAEPVEPVTPDGRVTLKLPVFERSGFVAWALGNDVEVVEPNDLRAEVARRLARLQELVGDAPA